MEYQWVGVDTGIAGKSIAFGTELVELWTERTGFTTRSPAEIAHLAADFSSPAWAQNCPSQ